MDLEVCHFRDNYLIIFIQLPAFWLALSFIVLKEFFVAGGGISIKRPFPPWRIEVNLRSFFRVPAKERYSTSLCHSLVRPVHYAAFNPKFVSFIVKTVPN
jgi:hypothetical protein